MASEEQQPISVYQVNISEGSSGIHVGNVTKHYYQESTDESFVYQSYCRKKIKCSFVETTQFRRAREVIETEDALVIIGHSGYGKTSILHYISANPMKGYLPILCTNPKEIKEYIRLVQGSNMKLLFVVDEPFGGAYIQQIRVDSWVSFCKELEIYLGEHKFLFSSRASVWADCKVHFETSPFFCNKVDISPGSLTYTDRRNLLVKYVGDSGKLTGTEIEDIVNITNPVAFCQCCKLMGDAVQRGQSGDELVQIFKKPFSYLRSELQKMRNVKYATLCLVMLCGDLKCRELTCILSQMSTDVRNIVEVIWETCACDGPLHVAVKLFQESAEKLSGIFLEKLHKAGDDSQSCEVYTFSHDSIREAVTMQYGALHFRHCLQFLPHDTMVKISRPHNYVAKEHEFAVCVPNDVDNIADLAEVFTEAAAVGNWALYNVFQNPFVREENFQRVWCTHLKSCSDKLTAFIGSKSWDGSCVDCLCYRSNALTLLWFLVADLGVKCKCMTDSSDPLSEAVSRDDIQAVRNIMTSHGQTNLQICQSFLTACRHGSINVLEMLQQGINKDRLDDATVASGLKSACYFGHCVTVELLLETYYNPCRKKDCGCGEGLVRASGGCQSDIVLILLSHGADINFTDNLGWTGLHWAVWHGHIQIVETLLQHGADIHFTDKHFGRTCLHLAALYGHRQIVRVLIHHGADRNAKDRENNTALDLAKQADHTELADMLTEREEVAVVGKVSELYESDIGGIDGGRPQTVDTVIGGRQRLESEDSFIGVAGAGTQRVESDDSDIWVKFGERQSIDPDDSGIWVKFGGRQSIDPDDFDIGVQVGGRQKVEPVNYVKQKVEPVEPVIGVMVGLQRLESDSVGRRESRRGILQCLCCHCGEDTY